MSTILVTGAEGQLGLTLQKLQKNYPEFTFVFASKEQLDITKKESITKIFSEVKPEYCINCAAYTNVEKAEEEPEKAFLINADGVKNLAEACNESNTTLIHISTDYVFDGEKESPYTADDIPNPLNEYGKSKLKGEHYIQENLNEHYIVRTSWLYHKEFGHNFYKTIVKKAKTESVLYVTDEQKGCPTNTESLAIFLMSLIEKDSAFGLYHFSGGKPMTWLEFAKQIVEENNLKVEVQKSNFITKVKRPKYSVLKTTVI
jgi:dTDP-4-dehydrorhamnose reductase